VRFSPPLITSACVNINVLDSPDSTLREYANKCQLTAISVGYPLAPEHPYPAAVHDAIDAAEYIVDHAVEVYGAPPLRFLGGESAGACLAALSALQLMRSRPSYKLSGLLLPYGLFDLALGLLGVVQRRICA
jgi:acetyl esterase/lipase